MELTDWLRTGISVILSVVAYGGIWKFVGDKWFDRRFMERQEKLKHQHQTELEGIRERVQREFSRIAKIHDKEYEVLPKAWFLLQAANGATELAVSPMKERMQLSSLSPEQLKIFLEESELSHSQKLELEDFQYSQPTFDELTDRLELHKANEALRLFNNYIIEHRIFMTGTIADLFEQVNVGLRNGLSDCKIGREHGNFTLRSGGVRKVNEVQTLLPTILDKLQDRLNFERA